MIKNERGAIFVYSIFIIFITSVISLPLLKMSSYRELLQVRDHHQTVADHLAVSIAEEFLKYLDAYDGSITKEQYMKNFYQMKASNASNIATYRELPDGTPLTYSISYEKDPTTQDLYHVTTKVVSGDTDRNHIANEKYSYERTITYSINTSSSGMSGSPAPVKAGSNVMYYGGNVTINNSNVNRTKFEGVHDFINNYMNGKKQSLFDQQVTPYSSSARCDFNRINVTQQDINSSESNPVVVCVSNLTIDKDTSITLGSPTKEVILKINQLNVNSGKKLNINVFGNLIVDTFYTNSRINIQVSRNFIVTNTIGINSGNQGHSIEVGEVFYAKTMTNNVNGFVISTNTMIVEDNFTLNNKLILNAVNEIMLGSLSTNTSHSILATEIGDIFIRDNFTMNNHIAITAKGNFAVGRHVTINNHIDLKTGGGLSVLHPDGSDDNALWNPKRK